MKRFWFLAFLLIFIGCRSSKVMKKDFARPPDYTVIYVIHGDSNYLYHNALGKGLQADEQALKTAKAVGKEAENGQVFIYHQQPEHKILWIFPKKDRQFYYYRNGRLLVKKKYSPHSKKKPFTSEASLYHQFNQATNAPAGRRIFLYFGHEIPVRKSRIYNFSRPAVPLTTARFATGVASFTNHGKTPFDLTVLSTCNNGTPSMVNALSPFTRYVLASPQNLHLSYMDTGRLPVLLKKGNSTRAIADSIAAHTYRRLSSFLQTAITLSVYDTHKTKSYLSDLSRRYASYLQGISKNELIRDNADCRRLPFFDASGDTAGIKTWYKAPRFGEKNNTQASSAYSGWGCK